jgi:sortase (surface protein transpeptidase)
MSDLWDRLRLRVVPALLTAFGVMLLTGGLLSYADPATAGPEPSETPVIETLPPDATDVAIASQTPSPSVSPSIEPSVSPSDLPSLTPTDSPPPTPDPTLKPGTRAVATRVIVPGLGIDLPIMKGPAGYPPCNVALYLKELKQPGEKGATYLYAHARTGMFLPFLEASKVNNGKRMLGMLVQVYTSDNELHIYEINQVRRHQRSLDQALNARSDQLWLQTSEGPNSSYPKLMVVAKPLSTGPASYGDAHPKARPVDCE